jgi:uncharacterized protein YjbJ (UPF0337 family)
MQIIQSPHVQTLYHNYDQIIETLDRRGVFLMPKDSMWDQIEGKWKQIKGDARIKWAKLTDDDVEEVKGNREKLAGKIQERYGVARSEAERQVDEWAEKHDM